MSEEPIDEEEIEDPLDLLHAKALHLMEHGDLKGALSAFEDFKDASLEAGDRAQVASALNSIGHVLVCSRDNDGGLRNYSEALKVSRECEDLKEIARSYHNLGTHHEGTGDYSLALTNLLSSLAYQRRGEIDPVTTTGYVWGIKKVLKFQTFRELISAAYEEVPAELRDEIDIEEFTRDRTVTKEVTAGRNDPCPCGSGKKFKRCCAA